MKLSKFMEFVVVVSRFSILEQRQLTSWMLFFHLVYDFGCVRKIFLQIKWQHDPNGSRWGLKAERIFDCEGENLLNRRDGKHQTAQNCRINPRLSFMPTSLENFRDWKNNKNLFETSKSSVIKLSFIQSSEAFSDDVLLSGNFSVAAGRI